MTENQMLKDVIEYYSVNPEIRRCIFEGGNTCRYSPLNINKTYEQSRGCGIGGYLDEETAKDWDDEDFSSIEDIYTSEKFDKAPKWMRKMDVEFLKDVQHLHDGCSNWDEKGLSGHGIKEVKRIVEEHGLSVKIFKKYL